MEIGDEVVIEEQGAGAMTLEVSVAQDPAVPDDQPPVAPAPPVFQMGELKEALKEALGDIALLKVECGHLREEED